MDPGAQPVRSRRRSAAARAGRPRPRGRRVRDRARAGGPRASRAQPRAHRSARRRQDGPAGRAALDSRSAPGGVRARSRLGPRPSCAVRSPPRCTGRSATWPCGTTTASASTRSSASSRRSPSAPPRTGAKLRDRWQPGIDVAARSGRADSGDIEIDLVELFTEVAGAGRGRRHGRRDPHRRDAGPAPGRRLGAVRGLPRAVAVACPAGGGRRRAAAPARGALGVEVLLRAAVPLLPDRPARPQGRRLRPARPGRAGRRHVRRRRPGRALRRLRRLSLLRPGLRQGRVGRRGAQPDHRRGRQDGRARRPRRSWPSASSGRATSGRPRPSASTCARWRS